MFGTPNPNVVWTYVGSGELSVYKRGDGLILMKDAIKDGRYAVMPIEGRRQWPDDLEHVPYGTETNVKTIQEIVNILWPYRQVTTRWALLLGE